MQACEKRSAVKSELIMQHDVKNLSPRSEIKPMTSRTPGGRSIHKATRTHGEQVK